MPHRVRFKPMKEGVTVRTAMLMLAMFFTLTAAGPDPMGPAPEATPNQVSVTEVSPRWDPTLCKSFPQLPWCK